MKRVGLLVFFFFFCLPLCVSAVSDDAPMVVASTASPYKFAADVLCSLTGEKPTDQLAALSLLSEPRRVVTVSNTSRKTSWYTSFSLGQKHISPMTTARRVNNGSSRFIISFIPFHRSYPASILPVTGIPVNGEEKMSALLHHISTLTFAPKCIIV